MLELSSYLPMKMISSKNLEINTLGFVMENSETKKENV